MARMREVFGGLTLANVAGAIVQNWRLIVAGLALGVVALGVWAGYDWYQSRREAEARDAFLKGASEIRKISDVKLRDEAAVKQFRLVSEQYAGTEAGGEAMVRLGHRLFDMGKYDEAREAYAKYLQGYSRGPLAMMAALGKAYAEESKGDLAAAEKSLAAAIDRGKDDALLGEAQVNLARVYEGLKKPDEALKVYGQVAETLPQTRWGQFALERMGSLKTVK